MGISHIGYGHNKIDEIEANKVYGNDLPNELEVLDEEVFDIDNAELAPESENEEESDIPQYILIITEGPPFSPSFFLTESQENDASDDDDHNEEEEEEEEEEPDGELLQEELYHFLFQGGN